MRRLLAFWKRERVQAWTQIVLGCIVGAAAYPLFLTPCAIVPGGLTGVSMILNRLLHTPIGVTNLVLCLPLFLAGWRQSGFVFVLRSLGATALFSLLIDILPLPAATDDLLLSSVFGALLLGVGLALILRGGATTGGTDMMAEMLHRRFPSVRVGIFLSCLDGCVILAAAFIMGMRAALYALINILIAAYVIDQVLAGTGNAKACFIISEHTERITQRLMSELERGVTVLDATGAYSGEPRPVVLCVCASREVVRVKQITRQEDLRAFVIITDTHETLGEGFRELR